MIEERIAYLERQMKALSGLKHNFMPGYNGLEHISQGSAFPNAVKNNTVFFRTDLGLLCYYDGTQWLTAELFRAGRTISSLAASQPANVGLIRATQAVYVDSLQLTSRVSTNNDGTDNWTMQWKIYEQNYTDGSATDISAAFDTSGDTADVFTVHNEAVSDTTPQYYGVFAVSFTKNNSPGNITAIASVFYRYIIT